MIAFMNNMLFSLKSWRTIRIINYGRGPGVSGRVVASQRNSESPLFKQPCARDGHMYLGSSVYV